MTEQLKFWTNGNFFYGQRAGRELRAEKPKEVQNEDIANFCRDLGLVREALEQQRWIPCSERMPEPETEVLALCRRGGVSFVCPAMYEDGTIIQSESIWNWNEIEGYGLYSEEADDWYIPEGWWEYRQLWIAIVALNEAFGFGGERAMRFMEAMEKVEDECRGLARNHGGVYARDKLMKRASQITGIAIQPIHEDAMVQARKENEAQGIFFKEDDPEKW